jgi:hypothetical protein
MLTAMSNSQQGSLPNLTESTILYMGGKILDRGAISP